MKKHIIRLVSIVLIVCLLIAPFPVTAGFVDDWLNARQSAGTPPNYYESQKRGYYTVGSFSARWPTSTDYMFTITPPKMKAGCGGIDMFMGGFSFLNFEYLVQKLQNMIQAAPAVAFDIALQVLSEQLRNAGIDLEGIINKLNSLQFDDCKASKALVATLVKPGFDAAGTKLPGEYATAVSDFLVSSGINNLYKTVQNNINSNRGNNPDPGNVNRPNLTADCPQTIKEIFNVGSVVRNLAEKNRFGPYTNLIRGMIGDVYITERNGITSVSLLPPCDGAHDMKSFLHGNAKVMDNSNKCVDLSDRNRDITKYVERIMTEYAISLRSKAPISRDSEDFIKATPLPVARILKTAVATDQVGSTIATLSNVVAYNLVYHMMSDFLNRVENLLYIAAEAATSHSGSTDDPNKCNHVITGIKTAKENLGELSERARAVRDILEKMYIGQASQINAAMELVQKLEAVDKKMHEELSRHFSKDTVNHAIK